MDHPLVERQEIPKTQVVIEHVKKTKEDMMHEPLPLFDCMYCVASSSKVLKMVSENFLVKRYSK